jgi:UDP-N-acetylglucosamine--N-acetylmuramyl-(pentapeptide) pyrophosphoryl-undecaprenol N-acetylglucosamine transferase
MLDLPLGVVHCIKLISAFKPQVVVGVGGYASGPAMMAAILLGIPTLAYEPNAVPGMTNRWIGKRVSAAAVNFPQTAQYFRNAEVTGVPVRPEIFALPTKPAGSAPRLLITAGSNGALVFNETMPKIISDLLAAVPELTVVHQSGPRALDATRASYAASGADPMRWAVEAFLTDMPAQYAAADLVLARSGSTVAELCAAGKPSLLVPFAAAADDHQRKNAEVLVQTGAAEMLLQRDVTPEALLHALRRLLLDPVRREKMSAQARTLAKPGALERIAALVLQLAALKT